MKCIVLALICLATLAAVPPSEIDWHPVEQLTGSFERVSLVTSNDQPMPVGVVVITGLVPTQRQVGTIKETLQVSAEKALALVETIDFTVERQELAIGTRPSPEQAPEWKPLSLKAAIAVLQKVKTEVKDVVEPSQISPVFTMPLPSVVGGWPKSITHPKLTAEFQLFRFMDFTVQPSRHYRYRFRFEYINPQFKTSRDPFIAAGETRLTPWSLPSPTVTVSP